jgi:hypothetical protein
LLLTIRSTDVDDDRNERGCFSRDLIRAGIDAVEREIPLKVTGGFSDGGLSGI